MGLLETFFNVDVMARTFPMLMRGLWNTVLLSVTAITFGIIIGVGLGLVRLYAPRPARWLAIFVIDFFRAVPILVILVLAYYALPFVGIRLSSFGAASSALALVLAAFTAEVFRAGIQSGPRTISRRPRRCACVFP